jgi:hypothetical protein
MCDCAKKLEKEIPLTQMFKGKKILKAELPWAFLFKSGMKLYFEAEIEVEGMKKKQKMSIIFSHCPFCGEEIKEGL